MAAAPDMNPLSKPIHTGIPQHTALLWQELFPLCLLVEAIRVSSLPNCIGKARGPSSLLDLRYYVGGVSFLPAPCSNLLPRSLVVFHLHGGSCCFITSHFLSWLDPEAGHVAETLAGQKEGNKFLFHLSGNLSSPGVLGHVRILSPGKKTNSYT